MRIVMLTSSFPSGPGDYRGRFVLEMAADWAAAGHDLTIIAPHPGQGAAPEEWMGSVRVQRVFGRATRGDGHSLFGGAGVLNELRAQPLLLGQIPAHLEALYGALLHAARGCDLIVSHWIVPFGLLGAKVARRLGIAHAVVEHGAGVRLMQPFGRPGAAVLRRLLDGTIQVQWVATHQQHWAREVGLILPDFVHPMPLPQPFLEPVEPRRWHTPLRALFLGRLVQQKGVDLLIEALRQTREIVATVAGDGPQRTQWQQAAKIRAPGRCRFVGPVDPSQVAHLMDRHDLLVLPSRAMGRGQEGTPRVLLEGMARGLVPLAAGTGGIPDWVISGQNGLLFQPGDGRGLAIQLTQLAVNRALCLSLSTKARETVQTLTWGRLRERWSASCRQAGLGVL